MSATDRWKQVQAILGTAQDGIPGPKDAAALEALRLDALHEHQPPLTGDGFNFSVVRDGEDLVVRNVRATCFGGTNDPQDSGQTASGISTKDPSVMGCALPRNYTGNHPALLRALGGSPIPAALPFKTLVEITSGNTKIKVPFIDLGPAKKTGNAIDLTIAAAKKFNPAATATNFEMICDYRIIGGAQFL